MNASNENSRSNKAALHSNLVTNRVNNDFEEDLIMADSDQIKVVVRIRPLIQREQQAGQDVRWSVQDEKVISQLDQPSLPPYTFDKVYDSDSSAWDLYSGVIAPIVDAAMNGYHGTVFVYGQSGSGKTYTMSGDKMTPGIITQAMTDIFNFIEQKPSHEFLMRASYMEIYNEKICDLLNKEDKHLKINETPDHQINVTGLEEVMVHSRDNVLSVIQKGEANRKFAETKQNDRSSRSHCIFRLIIESRKQNETNAAVMVSHLNFVDLAGSEKAGDNSGDRFREGCSINMSLFCLSNVISKLSEGVGKQFIGYRNSKLTRILQNALGGNSKTVIVATINPTMIEESHSTLRFATRAKTIKNKAHVNEVLSDAAMLKKYRNQISELEKLVKEMGVADIQSANEDLKKQLIEKQSLIKQLTEQIVVSSLTDMSSNVQKKKMRRETWCAPKVQRKSYFPSLPAVNHPSITIREETDLDLELTRTEDLGLPFTTISVCPNDESKAKAFLRRSDEMALSESLFSEPVGGDEVTERLSGDKELEEVKRLKEVMRVMKAEHAEELDKLQERIKQLEYEKAMELDLQEEREKNMVCGQEELMVLKNKMAHMQYECQLHVEENQLLQKNLWHAEEEIKRLKEETSHLCDKRFDFTLKEWEELQATKASQEAEMKQLVVNQQQKDKEIQELQKALEEQEPYIARLQQQLEAHMGAGNGLSGSGGGRRRSGIPVLVKSEAKHSLNPMEAREIGSLSPSVSTAVNLSRPEMVDCATSTEDLLLTSTSHTSQVDAIISPQMPAQAGSESSAGSKTVSADVCIEQDLCNVSVSLSKLEDVFSNQEGGNALLDRRKKSETTPPERVKVARTVVSSLEGSTKRAAQLKRRSDRITTTSENDSELSARLREQEHQLEIVAGQNTRLLEQLNQAHAEIVRYKEAMEAMEQADVERMEELSEVPKLRALLNRREMEIHRLESVNDHLKEEINQQLLNSSTSSVSSSFTEPRRKSAMLKEREAEIWKLKDQLIQQAKHLDDVQQEKHHLENMVLDFQTQPINEDDQDLQTDEKQRLSSSSSAASSVPSSSEMNASISIREEEEVEKETEHVTVTVAEMEAVQRMICDKDSCISRLKIELQEKEEEMDQMFEGRMLVSSDMIQTHLRQAEQQRERIEELEGQIKSCEEEIAKLRTRTELQHSSSASSCSSQGEESALLEQLIMDKMVLEENLQEKLSELCQAMEQNQTLQDQLNERRAVINELRQKHEDITEALLSTQEELIALKRSVENEETKNMTSQFAPCTENVCSKDLPIVKGEDFCEVSLMSQPVENSEQSPAEEPLTVREEEDSFEVSFKIAEARNAGCASEDADHIAEPPKLVHSEDSFEVKSKSSDAINAMSTDDTLAQRRQFMEHREVKLLEMLKETEKQVQSLKVLKEQELNSGAAGSGEDEKCSTTDVHINSTELPLQEQCNVLIEQKENLENKLQGAVIAIEEKTILETKVQELLKVVDEKSSEIFQLQKQIEDMKSQLEKRSLLAENDDFISHENLAAEKDALLAKLSLFSNVEERLQNNIKILEQCQEEKAALDGRVKDLEAKLKQLSKTGENESTDQETLYAIMGKKTIELESLQSQMEHIISLKTETEMQGLKSKEKAYKEEIQLAEETRARLVEALEQCSALEMKKVELAAKNEELTSTLEQITSEHEEINTELTWQTKENEKLQSRVEELETELEEQKQEAEDLVHDLEKVQKLQEDSEHCRRVVEDTLENFKAQNAKLEADLHVLATERDEFELRAEAAIKEQAHLRLELRVTSDRQQDKISSLEMELQTTEKRKQVLEAALADKESAHRMGELLHEKLSVDLLESQAEVGMMKTTLSQLQFELQSQEGKFHTLNKITVALEAEKEQLVHDKSSLEQENLELKDKLSTLEDEVKVLQKDLNSKQAIEERKQILETEVLEHSTEVQWLQTRIQQLNQQMEASSQLTSQLQQERDKARDSCMELSEKISLLESRCMRADMQCQQMTNTLQQLQQSGEESEQRAASAKSECSRLQDELGCKLDHIELLEKEIEAIKVCGSSSSDGEKMIPLLENQKQKFVLKKQIASLTEEVEKVKKVLSYKEVWIKELHDKLSRYENEEQEDEDEKIKKLENDLKARDMELVGINIKHQDDIAKLSKQLSHAEEMVTYKEQIISKLKGEIRRIRSDEVSFCTAAAPKTKAHAPETIKAAEDERVSSHSGIIDRYTVTLLEADKYKLQKELKKTQERLKSRESELHWTKVALAKAKTGDSSIPSSPSSMENIDKAGPKPASAEDSEVEQKPAPALLREPSSETLSKKKQCSPLLQKLGTSVDEGLTSGDFVSRGAGDCVSKGAGDTVLRSGFVSRNMSRTAPKTGGDSISRAWKQEAFGLLQSSVSASGSSVDVKKDRHVLPSSVDKENTPFGTDVIAHKVATDTTAQDVTHTESPINIKPEFWKKSKQTMSSLHKPSSMLGKSAATGADQCKTQ